MDSNNEKICVEGEEEREITEEDWKDLIFFGNEEKMEEGFEGIFDEDNVLLEVESAVKSSEKKERRKMSKRNVTAVRAYKKGDTVEEVMEGMEKEMKGTAIARKQVLTKFNEYWGLKIEKVEDVVKIDDDYFTDEKLALFIAEVARQTDYGKSSMKKVNAALGDWLNAREKPRYFEEQHKYPQVVKVLKVKAEKVDM